MNRPWLHFPAERTARDCYSIAISRPIHSTVYHLLSACVTSTLPRGSVHKSHDSVLLLLACIHIISQTLLARLVRQDCFRPTGLKNIFSEANDTLGTSLFFSRRNGARDGLHLCEVLLSFGSVCKASIPSRLLNYTLDSRT